MRSEIKAKRKARTARRRGSSEGKGEIGLELQAVRKRPKYCKFALDPLLRPASAFVTFKKGVNGVFAFAEPACGSEKGYESILVDGPDASSNLMEDAPP